MSAPRHLGAVLVLLGVGACPRELHELGVNLAPVARVVAPQLWPAGEPVSFDPSYSEDPEGGPLRFRVTFGDGTPDAEGGGIVEHVYAAPATYGVELVATDEQGLDERVRTQVVIIGDALEACTCELPCAESALCVGDTCRTFASSVDDDDNPLEGAQLACP